MPFLGGRGQASRGYFGGGTTPDAPTSLVSTKGNGQISVAFTAPGFDGGLPITTYEYALSTSNYVTFITRSTGTTASPLVITGLTNGTSYGVRIRAVNSLGTGIVGIAAAEVIPSTVPNVPTSVSATSNANTASAVTWTAPTHPANTGGAAITGYKIEYAASPYSSYTVLTANTGTTATSATITGLSNGTSYKIRISATNLNGFGATAESGVIVPSTVPGAPTASGASDNASTESEVTWTAPASNGGASITDYVVQYSTSSTFASSVTTFNEGVSAALTATVTGLTNGTTYYFRIAAVNASGTGAYSGTVIGYPSTVPGAPGKPVMVRGTGASTTDTWTWTAPASTGGSAITEYEYQYYAGTTTSNALLLSHSVSGYTTDTFALRARARNASGWGAYTLFNTQEPIPTPASGAWALGAVSDAQICSSFSCVCPACAGPPIAPPFSVGGACGASTGTNSTATQSRGCYTWSRSGNNESAVYNSNGSTACNVPFGACSGGSCTGCSACEVFDEVNPITDGSQYDFLSDGVNFSSGGAAVGCSIGFYQMNGILLACDNSTQLTMRRLYWCRSNHAIRYVTNPATCCTAVFCCY